MHKYLNHEEHSLANLVNYVTSYRPNQFVFSGFVPSPSTYFGVYFEGKHYLPVFLSTEEIPVAIADEEEREEYKIAEGCLWVAMFYGNDNCSYIKRFLSEKHMKKWFKELTVLSQDDSWIFYNS